MFEKVELLKYPHQALLKIPNICEVEKFQGYNELEKNQFPCLKCPRCYGRKTFTDKVDCLVCFYTNDENIQHNRFVATINHGKIEYFKKQPVFCYKNEKKRWIK